MVPRLLSVLALATVSGVAGVQAVSAESEDTPPAPVVSGPAAITPVLSARRVPGLLAAPTADRRLAAALDELLARQPGTTCLTVTDAGRVVYLDDPDLPLNPASVLKLVTAIAAIEVLGPDHRFRTTVVAGAAPVDGVVTGDAWLVGSGDPLLATADYAARFRNQPQTVTPLESLAEAIGAAGIVGIDGALIGDGSRYDDDRYPDAWPSRFVDQDQSGPLSALTVNDGWQEFPPSPDARGPDETPAVDPEDHAASVFSGLLAERGVSVGATASGAAPAGAVELAAIESPPLEEIVGEMLRESDNQTGELLLKELAVARGRPATTAEGAAIAVEVVAGLGLPVGGLSVADGSGLGDGNAMSCSLALAILNRSGPDSPIGRGLAVAGQTGTLSSRFLDVPVTGRLRAKTGTLSQVTALAGFVHTAPGATLTFSFIVNLEGGGVVGDDDLARQDELAAILLRYPEGPPIESLGPLPLVPAAEG